MFETVAAIESVGWKLITLSKYNHKYYYAHFTKGQDELYIQDGIDTNTEFYCPDCNEPQKEGADFCPNCEKPFVEKIDIIDEYKQYIIDKSREDNKCHANL